MHVDVGANGAEEEVEVTDILGHLISISAVDDNRGAIRADSIGLVERASDGGGLVAKLGGELKSEVTETTNTHDTDLSTLLEAVVHKGSPDSGTSAHEGAGVLAGDRIGDLKREMSGGNDLRSETACVSRKESSEALRADVLPAILAVLNEMRVTYGELVRFGGNCGTKTDS